MNAEEQTGERSEYFIAPRKILELFEDVGEKAEVRWAQDHPKEPSSKRPDQFDGIFSLPSGKKAKFGWIRSPQLYRPDHWLPSGSLTIKGVEDGVERTDQYFIGRNIMGATDAQPIVEHFTYEDDNLTERTRLLRRNSDKLKEVHSALKEIERIIKIPDSPIDWHYYGQSYEW